MIANFPTFLSAAGHFCAAGHHRSPRMSAAVSASSSGSAPSSLLASALAPPSASQNEKFALQENLKQNKCKRLLLPGGLTDELQLTDDSVGHALKKEMDLRRYEDRWTR